MSTPAIHRVVCVSRANPATPANDILTVCHNFPEPRAQSGVRGRLLTIGGQYVLLLEGVEKAVRQLVERIRREVPEPAMEVRVRDEANKPAFESWSITDLYHDEIALEDEAAAESLSNLVIDLMTGAPLSIVQAEEEVESEEEATEPVDAFAEIAALLDRFAWTPGAGPLPFAEEAA